MKRLTKAPKTSNINWLFYKDYFKDEKGNHLFRGGQETENLIAQKIENILNQKLIKLSPLPLDQYLDLTTIYPGLLIGSGYQHEIGGVAGEFQLGFFFDYTTGMPIVAGSSVKGVLRSAFPYNRDKLEKLKKQLKKRYKDDKKKVETEYQKIEEINLSKQNYIISCLDKDTVDISALQEEVFESRKDKFFDAFIIKSDNINESFLDDDYITPHNDEFKDPIPLRFLKVSPNVTFRFYFDLQDGIITEVEKLLLFDKILQDLGVGAKTNVGYGQLIGNDEKILKERQNKKAQEDAKQHRQRELENMSPIDRIFANNENNIVKIILMMQNDKINEFDTFKIELAKKIKIELQKNPKTWDRAKQKALKRKEFIELLLKE